MAHCVKRARSWKSFAKEFSPHMIFVFVFVFVVVFVVVSVFVFVFAIIPRLRLGQPGQVPALEQPESHSDLRRPRNPC